MSSDALGAKGEARFREICADEELICNPSLERDRTGWDFIVEFEGADRDSNMSFDSRPAIISSHIQVKTVLERKSKAVKLTLSSAEFLAKEGKPSFIYVCVVKSDLTFASSYLIHVWGDVLSKILARLRRATSDKAKLRGKTISFDAKKYGQELPCTGLAIKREIERIVDQGLQFYSTRKQALLASLGFEHNPISMNFSIEGASVDEIEEWLLGSRSIKVSNFSVFETRFGIELPLHGGGSSTLNLTPSPIRSLLRARQGAEYALIEADILAPFVRRLSEGGLMVFRHELFEVRLRNNKLSFQTNPPSFQSRRETVKFWSDYYKFMNLLVRPNCSLDLKIPGKNFEELGSGITADDETINYFSTLMRGVESYQNILDFCGECSIKLSPAEILETVAEAEGLDHALIRKVYRFTPSFAIYGSPPLRDQSNTKVLLISLFAVASMFVAYAYSSTMEGFREEEGMRFVGKEVNLERIAILEASEAAYREFVDRAKQLCVTEIVGVRELAVEPQID